MRLDLSPHAVARMVEFGIGEDVVADIVGRPSVRYPSRANHARGDVYQSSAHPAWAVVADPPQVITVLRRELDRWEHEASVSTFLPPHASTTLRDAEDDRPDLTPPGSGPVTRRRSVAPRTPRNAVVALRVEPCVLALAQQLADGDLRRLILNADGTVVVLNRPRGRLA